MVSATFRAAGPMATAPDSPNVRSTHLPEEETMAVSDDLSRLSVRAKQAEARAAAAKAQAREQLERMVREAGESTRQTAENLRTASSAAKDRADAGADKVRSSWSEHMAEARARQDARKTRHAADRAEFDAEDAEDYAAFSIDLA